MKRYAILFIGRERAVEHTLLAVLQQHYSVAQAATRKEAMNILAEQSPDLILIDMAQTRFKIDRFCNDIKERVPHISIFFLLGKGMRLDRLPQASGHLRYPFTKRQLLGRLARILPEREGDIVEWQGLKLSTGAYLLSWEVEEIPLTPKQALLLLAFLQHPDEILSRARLMQDVWGTDYLGDTRTLDVHIHWLRQALKKLRAPFQLETKRGKGYRLIALAADPPAPARSARAKRRSE